MNESVKWQSERFKHKHSLWQLCDPNTAVNKRIHCTCNYNTSHLLFHHASMWQLLYQLSWDLIHNYMSQQGIHRFCLLKCMNVHYGGLGIYFLSSTTIWGEKIYSSHSRISRSLILKHFCLTYHQARILMT